MNEPPDTDSPVRSRRRLLALAGAVGLAGCLDARLGGRPAGTPTTEPGPATGTTTDATTTDEPTATTTTTTTEQAPEPTIDGVPVARNRYSLEPLPYAERPQFYGPFRESEPECRHTTDKIEEVPNLIPAEIDGDSGHFPLRTTRWLLRLLHCYRETGDERYRRRAAEMSDALVEDAGVGEDDALYFSYRVDKSGSSASLTAPWYSGMCQGVGLSAYTYFHELTGEDRYRRLADRVRRSFTTLRRHTDGPWTAMVDDDYYWVEEYPATPPTHVFNGYVVGLWGLYDHWMHVRTRRSRLLLEAGLTTLERYVDRYRVPGHVSYYGLDGYRYWEHGQERYPEPYRGNLHYHDVHIVQLRKLHRVSGADRFDEVRRLFERDRAAVADGE